MEFLVISSDGLWDVISNEDVVSLVKSIEDPEAAIFAPYRLEKSPFISLPSASCEPCRPK